MKIGFPYKEIPALEVPDESLLGEFQPKAVPRGRPTAEQVAEALRNPIESEPLGRLARRGDRVLLLSDDFTRPTPVAEMLPPVLQELLAAGVGQGDIRILLASGTHRPMTGEELERKLGPETVRDYEVRQHYWQSEQDNVNAGETAGGLPIVVNRRVIEADLVIGLGHIVPHRIPGFSGGSKIIYPGVTGPLPGRRDMHWLAAQMPAREVLGSEDNPIRRELDDMGRRVGLRFIVNVVQGTEGNVAAVFAGDPVAAHRHGVEVARDVYGLQLPAPADIVVIDSYPADVDFWQAGKAVYASELAVRRGGVVILVTPCPEGVARHHPAVLEYGVRPLAELRRLVESGELEDIVAAGIMALTAWVVKERATGIMVSPGITAGEKQRLGFLHAETPQEALDMAFQHVGREARVAVLHHGGEILPLVPQGAEAEVAAGERVAAHR